MKKFAPPGSTVKREKNQGRWLGTYAWFPSVSKSWTPLNSEKQAVTVVLRYLWDCHAAKAGLGPMQGVTICPHKLIFKDAHVPDAESQPSKGKQKKQS